MKKPVAPRTGLTFYLAAAEVLLLAVQIFLLIVFYPKFGRGIGYALMLMALLFYCVGLVGLFTARWWWLLIAAAVGTTAFIARADPHTWLSFLTFSLPFLVLIAAVPGMLSRFAAKEIKQYLKERKEQQKEETHPQDGEQTP